MEKKATRDEKKECIIMAFVAVTLSVVFIMFSQHYDSMRNLEIDTEYHYKFKGQELAISVTANNDVFQIESGTQLITTTVANAVENKLLNIYRYSCSGGIFTHSLKMYHLDKEKIVAYCLAKQIL